MLRLTLVLFAVVGPTIAGSCLLAVLIIPALAAHDAQLILPASLLGGLIALPVSYFIARKIAPVLAQ